MFTFPLLLTIYTGFAHAFEADHLLAVSNIVSQRGKMKLAVKDGFYWGLGHTSTIFFIGMLVIVFKAGVSIQYFNYFEAGVGLMLVLLAGWRLVKFFGNGKLNSSAHVYKNSRKQPLHLHVDAGRENRCRHPHALAYGVGLMHGLAGSGALIVIVMSQLQGSIDGLAWLALSGIACIAGMMLAAGLFSIPFSKKVINTAALQSFLIITSSLLCLMYGTKVIYENLIAAG